MEWRGKEYLPSWNFVIGQIAKSRRSLSTIYPWHIRCVGHHAWRNSRIIQDSMMVTRRLLYPWSKASFDIDYHNDHTSGGRCDSNPMTSFAPVGGREKKHDDHTWLHGLGYDVGVVFNFHALNFNIHILLPSHCLFPVGMSPWTEMVWVYCVCVHWPGWSCVWV